MTDPRCWGIYRENQFSLHRVDDDAEILRATARQLEEHGFTVALKTPEEVARAGSGDAPRFVFSMCVHPDRLERLREWVTQGVVMVNDPAATLRTLRAQMLEGLARGGIPFPESMIVSTGSPVVDGMFPCWVKRADVHRTDDGDVTLAAGRGDLARILEVMAGRGIARAVVQRHVPGDLIKFYGVAPGPAGEPAPWFTWFYHREQALARHPFDERELALHAAGAAASLGLEVFGGDAIATAEGRLFVIDVNGWPSFALYRPVASARIAAYLTARFRVPAGAAR